MPRIRAGELYLNDAEAGTGESDKPKDAYSTHLIARDAAAPVDALGIQRAHVAGTSTGGCVLQHLALDYPDRVGCCVFTNTWTKADPSMTRVQTSRKQIALAYGQDEYITFSSLWTCGWTQFRHMHDNLLELERRQRDTIAPVEVLVARLDMTLAHDRTADLGRIGKPSLIIAAKDDPLTPPVLRRGTACGDPRLTARHAGGRGPLQLPAQPSGVERCGRCIPAPPSPKVCSATASTLSRVPLLRRRGPLVPSPRVCRGGRLARLRRARPLQAAKLPPFSESR